MKEKFFTPDIEDIHVGFECELQDEKSWNPFKFYRKYDFEIDLEKRIHNGTIRVPFLTKEQIEAEGWEYVRNTNKVDVDICYIFNKNNYMLGWFPLINKIAVLIRDPSKAFDKKGILIEYTNTERYTGSCKDINTFRKIIKLLGI